MSTDVLILSPEPVRAALLGIAFHRAGWSTRDEADLPGLWKRFDSARPKVLVCDDPPRLQAVADWLAAQLASKPVPLIGIANDCDPREGVDILPRTATALRDVVVLAQVVAPGRQRLQLVRGEVLTLLRALSTARRSGVVRLRRYGPGWARRAEVRLWNGEFAVARAGEVTGLRALLRICTWQGAEVDYVKVPVSRTNQFREGAPALLERAQAHAEEWEALVESAVPENHILDIDPDTLVARLKDIPDEVNSVTRLCDGTRCLATIIEESPYRDRDTAMILGKLLHLGVVTARAPAPSEEDSILEISVGRQVPLDVSMTAEAEAEQPRANPELPALADEQHAYEHEPEDEDEDAGPVTRPLWALGPKLHRSEDEALTPMESPYRVARERAQYDETVDLHGAPEKREAAGKAEGARATRPRQETPQSWKGRGLREMRQPRELRERQEAPEPLVAREQPEPLATREQPELLEARATSEPRATPEPSEQPPDVRAPQQEPPQTPGLPRMSVSELPVLDSAPEPDRTAAPAHVAAALFGGYAARRAQEPSEAEDRDADGTGVPVPPAQPLPPDTEPTDEFFLPRIPPRPVGRIARPYPRMIEPSEREPTDEYLSPLEVSATKSVPVSRPAYPSPAGLDEAATRELAHAPTPDHDAEAEPTTEFRQPPEVVATYDSLSDEPMQPEVLEHTPPVLELGRPRAPSLEALASGLERAFGDHPPAFDDDYAEAEPFFPNEPPPDSEEEGLSGENALQFLESGILRALDEGELSEPTIERPPPRAAVVPPVIVDASLWGEDESSALVGRGFRSEATRRPRPRRAGAPPPTPPRPPARSAAPPPVPRPKLAPAPPASRGPAPKDEHSQEEKFQSMEVRFFDDGERLVDDAPGEDSFSDLDPKRRR